MHKQPRRLALAGTAVLLGALAVPASAADPAESARIRELEQKLERSMQLIEELSGKVKQLERNAGTPASGPENARIDALQQQVSDLTAANSRRGADDGLPIHGFADVGVGRSSERNAADGVGSKGFTVGSFDLYLTPQFGSRVKSLVELIFEVEEDGGLLTDLERAQIGYTFSDALTVWAGRFHTPFGYWNTAFHHGQQIQTSITRPRFLDFEDAGGILPAHTTGAWANGAMRLGENRVGYDLYVGNSPRITEVDATSNRGVLDMKMGGDTGHNQSVGFNVSLRPSRLPDLTLGVHGLRGKVHAETAVATDTRLGMFGAYAVFTDDNWEVMGEYYRFRNRDLTGGTGSHRSSAWYTQAGYNFGAWTPFLRFEKTRLDQSDNYFVAQASGRSYKRAALGLRYDLDPKAALKFELDRNRKDDLGAGIAADNFTEARFQYAIRF